MKVDLHQAGFTYIPQKFILAKRQDPTTLVMFSTFVFVFFSFNKCHFHLVVRKFGVLGSV